MKKIFLFILIFLLTTIIEVKADNITFDAIAEKMEESSFFDTTGTINNTIQLTIEKNSMLFSAVYFGAYEIESIINYNNGIIFYEFDQEKIDQDKTAIKAFNDNLIFSQLVSIIAELKDVSENDFNNWYDSLVNVEIENLSLENDGIELNEAFNYSSSGDEDSLKEWYDSYKIDINKLNFEIHNPDTNITLPIIGFGIIVILLVVILIYIKKKKIFVNI